MYQKIEGEHWRHVWVVSDIHGCYQWLMDELKRRHFNPDTDLLISVGGNREKEGKCRSRWGPYPLEGLTA